MSERIRRSLAFVIAIGMVIAVASAPTVAQVADENAERVFELAANADSVDGQHAVKYSTKKSKRANKLVATNAAGVLPPNIIEPRWKHISGMPRGFADGVDNIGPTYAKKIVYDSTVSGGSLPAGESRRVTVKEMPRSAGVHFNVVPLQGNHNMRIEDVEVWWDNDGSHHYVVSVRNASPWPVQFKLRATIFD